MKSQSKWEYLVVRTTDNGDSVTVETSYREETVNDLFELTELLNSFGKEGWEMVTSHVIETIPLTKEYVFKKQPDL